MDTKYILYLNSSTLLRSKEPYQSGTQSLLDLTQDETTRLFSAITTNRDRALLLTP
jgi:hypothetical protein